jgi:hypothetical protein
VDAGEELERGRLVGGDSEAMYCIKRPGHDCPSECTTRYSVPVRRYAIKILRFKLKKLRIVTLSIKSSGKSYS